MDFHDMMRHDSAVADYLDTIDHHAAQMKQFVMTFPFHRVAEACKLIAIYQGRLERLRAVVVPLIAPSGDREADDMFRQLLTRVETYNNVLRSVAYELGARGGSLMSDEQLNEFDKRRFEERQEWSEMRKERGEEADDDDDLDPI